jgi:thiosulfate reductase cytochrome b subunit
MAEAPTHIIRRHSAAVRVTHWVNALCLCVLLMSGLQIFNAHPALYWGEVSRFDQPVLAMTAEEQGGRLDGMTRLFGRGLDTTGWLGASRGPDGIEARGFPSWMTLPSYQDLATGRRWHFLFAWLFVLNGTLYLSYSVLSGHLRRDLVPDLRDLNQVGRTILDHLRLRFPSGDEARRYNVVQKMTYLIVIGVLLPLMLLTGLTMSPGVNAAVPELLTVFGGRQSARTLHFLAAFSLVLFVLVHVAMVLLSGAWNNMRSMVTGSYVIRGDLHDTPVR